MAARRVVELLRVGDVLHSQGGNWEKWFDAGNFSTGGEYSYNPPYVHNVNAAQGLKSAAVRWRQSRDASLRTLSRTRVDKLDAHCGREIEMLRVCASRRGPGVKGGSGIKVSVRVHQSNDPLGEMKSTGELQTLLHTDLCLLSHLCRTQS